MGRRETAVLPEALVGLLGLVCALGATWLGIRAHARRSGGPDLSVAREVVGDRDRVLTLLAHLLTLVGSEAVMGGVGLVLLAVLCRRRAWVDALTVATSVAGAAALVVGLKLLVSRPRPGAAYRLGPVDHAWSFPSGHTLTTAVVVTLVAWVLVRGRAAMQARLVHVVAALLVLGVAASRVYLGYHWLSDVVASLLVAASWLVVVRAGRAAVLRGLSRRRSVGWVPATGEDPHTRGVTSEGSGRRSSTPR